ncbi:MAG: lysophospholipid acyltransferase family protein [Proteobacteria bacterium]|nr:lysophospholipid acyltransferase family protein [Pseudomonadota bacterium]
MFIDFFLISIVKTLQQIIRILPEHLQRATGVFFGKLAFFILKGRRNIAISNIRRAFGSLNHEEIKGIAKRCFEKLGVNFVEMLTIPYIPRSEYGSRFTTENRHHIDDALKQNKGVIVLIFHFTNWEIMGVASASLSSDIVVLARPLKKHIYINKFLNSLRSSTGLKVISNADTAKDVMRYLKSNSIVAILADQREKRSRGVFVELFGVKVPTSKGIAAIGMKTGAPVIPMYFVREGFLRYRVVWNEPIEMERKGDIDELIYLNTRKINAFLETIILKHPDEWFWVHRRWGGKRK